MERLIFSKAGNIFTTKQDGSYLFVYVYLLCSQTIICPHTSGNEVPSFYMQVSLCVPLQRTPLECEAPRGLSDLNCSLWWKFGAGRSFWFPRALPTPPLIQKMNYGSLQWFHWEMSYGSSSVMPHVLWKRRLRRFGSNVLLKRKAESSTSLAVLFIGGQSRTIIAMSLGDGVDRWLYANPTLRTETASQL